MRCAVTEGALQYLHKYLDGLTRKFDNTQKITDLIIYCKHIREQTLDCRCSCMAEDDIITPNRCSCPGIVGGSGAVWQQGAPEGEGL
jgi:hypothetical protein